MNKLNILYLTIFSLVILIMASCSEEIYDSAGIYKPSLESNYLSVSPRDYSFGHSEESQTGHLYSDNSWSFKNVPSWLKITPSNGEADSDFTLNAIENESTANREAVFYIEANTSDTNIQRTLTASQTGADPYIAFPEYGTSPIEVGGQSNYIIVNVNTNITDLAVISSQSWLKAEYNSEAKTINIEIEANESDNSRNATITASSSFYSKTAKLTISQIAAGASIIDGRAMDYEADGGTQTRTIRSDLPWTAKTTYSWIDFYPKSGETGETTINISVLPSYEADKRIGQIYFYFGETQKAYIGITQKGRYIRTSDESIEFAAKNNSKKTITIESNIEWSLVYSPDWLTITPEQGNKGNTIIEIEPTVNNSLNVRSSQIAFSDVSGSVQAVVSVSQNGIEFGDESVMEFDWKESSQTLSVPIPNPWVAVVSDDWITLSSSTGDGISNVIVSVAKNIGESTREGSISFTSEGKVVSVKIVQIGQFLILEKSSGEVYASGGNVLLSINTSVDLKYSVVYPDSGPKDWVNLSAANENVIKIEVTSNSSAKDRVAEITVSSSDNNVNEDLKQGVIFKLTQFGRHLSTDVSEITMYPKGGTSNTYVISADGEYSIEKSNEDFWYSMICDKTANTFYIIVAPNNSGMDRTGKIILTLSGLPSGEDKNIIVPVKQLGSDYNININDYDEDEILD